VETPIRESRGSREAIREGPHAGLAGLLILSGAIRHADQEGSGLLRSDHDDSDLIVHSTINYDRVVELAAAQEEVGL
jgi:hypothetical protein